MLLLMMMMMVMMMMMMIAAHFSAFTTGKYIASSGLRATLAPRRDQAVNHQHLTGGHQQQITACLSPTSTSRKLTKKNSSAPQICQVLV